MIKLTNSSNISKIIVPGIIVAAAIAIIYFVSANTNSGSHRVGNTYRTGTSLIFDTLAHMGYATRVSNQPITLHTSTSNSYVIIQPHLDHFTGDDPYTLQWVNQGGHLAFFHNSNIPLTQDMEGTRFGHLTVYEIGQGMIVTGRANSITNFSLMNTHDIGAQLHSVLSSWNMAEIIFVEYYHRPPGEDGFFNTLPLMVRLVIIQIIIVAVATVFYLGKRFGNPTPYYKEHERDENEHVHALARIYSRLKEKK